MDIDIIQLFENAIEKHKVILNTPITDKYGDKEGVYTRLNRIANEIAKIEYNEGNETPVKQLERYYNSIIYDFTDLPPLRQFQRAIITQKDSRTQDVLVQNFCSQPIETIIDQYAELIAYHKVIDELHRNLNPNFYSTKEKKESENTINNQILLKTEFHLKKHLEQKYPSLLKRFHNEFKGCFVKETLPLWLKRFNNLDEKPIKEIEFFENKLYNKKVLLAILITVHELVKNEFEFNDFVFSRFGWNYKSFKKNNFKEFDRTNPSSLYAKCQAILRSVSENINEEK